jgi:hypothetical protein
MDIVCVSILDGDRPVDVRGECILDLIPRATSSEAFDSGTAKFAPCVPSATM